MKTIIITGATGSVGTAAAKALSKKGDVKLVLVGRSREKLNKLKGELSNKNTKVEVVEADLGDTISVKDAVQSIKSANPSIDGIINIAAVYKGTRTVTKQNFETMMATNHLGPFALTNGLVDTLKATPGSKVLTVTAPSITKIDFDNLNGEKKFSAFNAFGGTKMMNLLYAFKLSKQFEGSKHASIAFHPGLVKSGLLKESPALVRGFFNLVSSKPEKTGSAIAQIITDGDPSNQNGKFLNNNLKPLKAAKHAYDTTIQDRLWKKSEEMLK